jgi:hypothetical protein
MVCEGKEQKVKDVMDGEQPGNIEVEHLTAR